MLELPALLVGSGAVLGLSLLGATPRVGLVRALTLAWRSAIKTTNPLSVRKTDMDALKENLQSLQTGQYVTVIGGKGNGKSRLIDTTVNRTFGVIKTSTESGASKRVIVDQVLTEITGINVTFLNLPVNAQRVLSFYNFFFERPPIVVIRVPERQTGEPYAQLTSAVRSLADEYGLRVVVDGPPNSLPPELLNTNRERVLSVEPMSRDMIESIPEFQHLIEKLRKCNLHDAVWLVLGGCPAKYMNVQTEIANCPDNDIADRVKSHLTDVLARARQFLRESSPNTELMVKLFREKNVLQCSASELEDHGLIIEYPNNVLREVMRGDYYVEPASSAVGLVIRDNINSPQDIEDLVERLEKTASQSGI